MSPESRERVAVWFREATVAILGYGPTEWSVVLGVSPTTLRDYLSGKRPVQAGVLWKMYMTLRRRDDATAVRVIAAWNRLMAEDRDVYSYVLEERLGDVLLALMTVPFDAAEEIMGQAIQHAHKLASTKLHTEVDQA